MATTTPTDPRLAYGATSTRQGLLKKTTVNGTESTDMEINITKFFREAEPSDYSGSMLELGQDAGKITWEAAKTDAAEYHLLDTEEKRQAFREYAASFGAWEKAEIGAWTDEELNALLIQFVAGDIRDMRSCCGEDWDQYEKDSEEGIVGGRLFRGDADEMYYYIGG